MRLGHGGGSEMRRDVGFWVSHEGCDLGSGHSPPASRHYQEASPFLFLQVGRLPTLYRFSNSLVAEWRPTQTVPFYSRFRTISLTLVLKSLELAAKWNLQII